MDDEDDTAPVSETNADGLLLLPGPRFPFDWSTGAFKARDTIPMYIFEEHNTGLGTGLTVWDGAVVLAGYLDTVPDELQNRVVVEVGSGTGFVGMAASLLGAHVTLTDLPYCLPNLHRVVAANEASLRSNNLHAPSVAALDWMQPNESIGKTVPARPDYVLGADVVWIPELIQPLVQTIAALAGPIPSSTVILLAHQTRSHASDALLWGLLAAHGFVKEDIAAELQHPVWRSDAIQLIRLTRPAKPGQQQEQ